MNASTTNIESIKREREIDTEWLVKYKQIVDGLRQIAEIQSDATRYDTDEWATVFYGLSALSTLMQEDIDGRKDAQ